MLAREVMTAPAITLAPDDTVKHAITVLDKADVTAAPVVDESGALVGIVSEADLLRGGVEHDPRGHVRAVEPAHEPVPRRVQEVMSTHVHVISEAADAADIADLMLATGVKSLPVVRGREVLGMVSRRDLLRELARDDERIQVEVTSRLSEYAGGASWQVSVDDGIVTIAGASGPEQERVATILARTVAGVVLVETIPVPRGSSD